MGGLRTSFKFLLLLHLFLKSFLSFFAAAVCLYSAATEIVSYALTQVNRWSAHAESASSMNAMENRRQHRPRSGSKVKDGEPREFRHRWRNTFK